MHGAEKRERGSRTSTRSGARAGVAAAVIGLGLLALAGGPAATAQPASSAIEIVQTADPEPAAGCTAGRDGWSYATEHSDTSFVLRVTTARTPCAPVAAVAAIYRMPGGATSWPQTLLERREVLIDRAGVTEFRFGKACSPVQFDVVTGDTPDTIAPWGESHGPLLFPADLRTAFQHRPARGCGTTTSAVPVTVVPTSVVTTSVPTTQSPTSTTPGDSTPGPGDTTDVGGVTTVSVPSLGSDGTDTTTDVLGTSVGRPSPPQVAGLAITGTSALLLAGTGVIVTVAGLALVWLGARRAGREPLRS